MWANVTQAATPPQLTARGAEIYSELLPAAEQFVDRMVQSLSKTEIISLTAMLDRLFRDLQEDETQ